MLGTVTKIEDACVYIQNVHNVDNLILDANYYKDATEGELLAYTYVNFAGCSKPALLFFSFNRGKGLKYPTDLNVEREDIKSCLSEYYSALISEMMAHCTPEQLVMYQFDSVLGHKPSAVEFNQETLQIVVCFPDKHKLRTVRMNVDDHNVFNYINRKMRRCSTVRITEHSELLMDDTSLPVKGLLEGYLAVSRGEHKSVTINDYFKISKIPFLNWVLINADNKAVRRISLV